MSLRRTAAVVMTIAVAALGLSLGTAGVAGAQAQAAAECEYLVSPVIITPPGGNVTVQGTAPPGSSIYIFVSGVLRPDTPIQADPVTGAWSYVFFATQTAEVTVSYGTQYPPTGCQVSPEQAELIRQAQAAARARALPRTGASGIGTNVLIAVVMVTVGAVLVVAMRRRDSLGRS